MKKIEDPLQTQVVHSGTLSQKTGLNDVCELMFVELHVGLPIVIA